MLLIIILNRIEQNGIEQNNGDDDVVGKEEEDMGNVQETREEIDQKIGYDLLRKTIMNLFN